MAPATLHPSKSGNHPAAYDGNAALARRAAGPG